MKSPLSLFLRLLPLLYALFFSHSVIAQQLFWLGTLGGLRSDARTVSADGCYATGWSQSEDGAYYPFRWDRKTQTMENLGSFGGRMSEGVAISADGRFIVGQSRDSSNRIHAFLWDAETRVLQNISRARLVFLQTGDISLFFHGKHPITSTVPLSSIVSKIQCIISQHSGDPIVVHRISLRMASSLWANQKQPMVASTHFYGMQKQIR